VLSSFGDFVFETTLLIWIVTDLAAGRGWSASVTSVLMVCSALPGFIVGPLAGVVVDRGNPHRIRLRMTWLSAALVAMLALTAMPGLALSLPFHLAAILGVVALASCAAQFLSPAASVMSRELLTDAELPIASASSQAMSNVIVLLAPATAAMLFAAFGPLAGLAINAATFAIAGLVTFRVRARDAWSRSTGTDQVAATFMDDFREGIAVVRSLARLRLIIGSLSLVMIAGGISSVLGIYFIVEQLGATTTQYGWIASAQGVGMIVGSVIAMRLLQRFEAIRVYSWALLVFGVLLFVYSRSQSIPALATVTAIMGIAIAVTSAPVGAMIITIVPRHVVGRVMSLIGPAFNGSMLVGMAAGGITYSLLRGSFDVRLGDFRMRPIDSIFTVSSFFVIAAGVLAISRLRAPAAVPQISPRTTP
jgi:MFS family permease